jgi:murein L,D-transpeptidase YcbB/YkuD
MRTRIETAGSPPKIVIGDEVIHSSVHLPRFYEDRAYSPAWIGDEGCLPVCTDLLETIRKAGDEGLRPGDYHLERIEAAFRSLKENREIAKREDARRATELDLLCTDAFILFGSHLLAGKVDPEMIDSEWLASRREGDMAVVLKKALESNRVEGILMDLLPQNIAYGRMKRALILYRELAGRGGWPSIPAGKALEKGDRNERVKILRNRLSVTGDFLSHAPADENLFEEELEEAVKCFQKRCGLDADGVAGRYTLAALNLPVAQRIQQIELNMERWRWLPQDLGRRYVLVNIADFSLEVREDAETILDMRIIVGRDYRRTPVFSDWITYLVFSPFWHIPPLLAVQDKLPLIKKDLNYLEEQKIRVLKGWGTDEKEIDPATIDWSKIGVSNFDFKLRQDSGPMNALGKVKFMFPNRFNVYLHDTPARELFAKTVRMFSSGCIRIEKPLDLALYCLREDPRWTRESISIAMNRTSEETVHFPEKIRIHLLYWTAWVDEDGTVHFRDDIYGRDRRLASALFEEPPEP